MTAQTDFKDPDHTGDWDIWLDCPECDFTGDVYYTTKPPSYCSPRCRQRARRRRAKGNVTNGKRGDVTYLLQDQRGISFEHTDYGRIEVVHLRCPCGRGIFTPPGNAEFAAIICGDCRGAFSI